MLFLAVAGLNGCRKPESGEVRVVVIADALPRLADPLSGDLSPAQFLLASNVAQGLVRFDASGNIAPGLAERWAVSDDGLSYVFRLRSATWSDGRKVRARDVVRLMERQLARRRRDGLYDTLGAVRDVVAMTDRVVAVELSAPRPHLLQLLAQPQFALVRGNSGTGPFTAATEDDHQNKSDQGHLLNLTKANPAIYKHNRRGDDERRSSRIDVINLVKREKDNQR